MRLSSSPITLFYQVQILIVVVCGAVLFFLAREQLFAFVAGAGLITVNFSLLEVLWARVLGKKPVATTIAVVIFKYAILGTVLYILVTKMQLPLVGLFAGLTTFLGSVIVAGFLSQRMGQ